MREAPEWRGATPSTPVPPRVRLRVFQRDGGSCQCGCGRSIRPGDAWETDHTISICNGGENKESNLRTLLKSCHDAKSATDVAEKSQVYQKRKKHLGIKKKSRFPCAKESKWKKKISGEVVRR